jgi:putative transposase
MIYGELRKKIGAIVKGLCHQKGLELHEGHTMTDHIHLLLSIPPKFSVSNTVGFIKGKSAIRIYLVLLGTKRDSRAKLLGDRLLCEHSSLG